MLCIFDWVHEASDPDRQVFDEPRAFALRAIPDTERSDVLAWIERYNDLRNESTVINNPHIYPVSEWQRVRQRTEEELAADFAAHDVQLAAWQALPVTHRMVEDSTQFAAIQTIQVPRATWEAFEIWQPAVARALANDDFDKLADLFRDPPLESAITDIYYVRRENGAVAICDYQGKRLPGDFWMTGRYRMNDLTGLAKS